MQKILLVEDEPNIARFVELELSHEGYEVVKSADGRAGLELAEKGGFDLVLLDIMLPGISGLEVLRRLRRQSEVPVIMLTARDAVTDKVTGLDMGADDYITKPFRKERILHVVEKAITWQRLQKENVYLREKLAGKPQFSTLLGTSAAMTHLHHQIERVADTSATVLITGESGTGKELVARAIHSHSRRRSAPFIPIDCSTIPETIIESELFGHVKGSFTGAIRDKKGLVEEADTGTLFLDEIGDLSSAMQVKLLRVLQEGQFKPVGSNAIRRVDIRFLTATNRNLVELIKQGRFREDLFYRLNVINIHLPPLRDRTEDIPPVSYTHLTLPTIYSV